MSIYGDFIEHFTELYRRCKFWDMEPTVEGKLIRIGGYFYYPCVIIEDQGDRLVRISLGQKGRTVLDEANHDLMLVSARYPVHQGMYCEHPDDGRVYKVTESKDYAYIAGYHVWRIERVTGADGRNDKIPLPVERGKIA